MLVIEALSAGILNRVNLYLRQGESVAVLGCSGSGKTTLLNAIAGYIPYRGTIFLAGQNLNAVPAWKRSCRYLNQQLYLFPHKTIGGNLALAQGNCADRQVQLHWLDKLKIAHLIDRYPAQISGGERQRAALARALIARSQLLLLDEPFSSLDWEIRRAIWDVVKTLREELQLTLLFVTHEPKEAEYLADRTVRLHQGRVILHRETI
ncbi:ATP-binding cassette domain-containing protein [Necropsobacter massiliensis]|uniref:ATP-binding cassette domain-containing protein n=1 Tax=Necropsobacter massiliensis TaxID=1400001 RepID=UPI0005958BF2|nr:ATP-binding cassette domain-containing protein [Necropsobacter massiliensis]